MNTKLLIARHGNTFAPGDVIRRVGITDLPLVESGLAQGRALGTYLKQNHLVPDVIFTSELKRTLQTAEQAQKIMRTHLVAQPLKTFNEIDYGPDEFQPENQVISRIGQEALQAWETQAIVPSGWNVNPEELIRNWELFAQKLQQEYAGKTCLLVTSNGIARFAPYLTGDFAQFTQRYKIKLATGAVCLLEYKSGLKTWHCSAWNVIPEQIST